MTDATSCSNFLSTVCHPIKRLVSRYYHALAIRPDTKDVLGDFEAYQELLTDYATNATTDFEPVFADEHVDDKIQKLTDDFLVRFEVGSSILTDVSNSSNITHPSTI